MTTHSISLVTWLVMGLCCVATLYATMAALIFPGRPAARAGMKRRRAADARPASVSVLKPLCGAEPRLLSNLETLCDQTHTNYQLLFGVAHANDAAVAVVQRLIKAYPDLDIQLIVDATEHGSNRKVSNLINIAERATSDLLVIADSDIAVEHDYLERVIAPLADPHIGIVTCLYRARGVNGGWTRIGAMFIDKWFAPSVYVAQKLGFGRFGFGATLALSRETLQRAGGFESLRDCLADDYWLADKVRALGLRTALSEVVVTTDVTERNFFDLWQRETRWLRTIRSVNPLGFALLCVTFTTPWLIASGVLGISFDTSGGDLAQSTADTIVDLSTSFGASASLLLHWRTAKSWRQFLYELPFIPLRDAMMFLQWIAACFGSTVLWRGIQIPVDSPSANAASASESADGSERR